MKTIYASPVELAPNSGLVNRCEICNKPFIYGQFENGRFIKEPNKAEHLNGIWAHVECHKAL